jgi:hypothetical protein
MRRNSGIIGSRQIVTTSSAIGTFDLFDQYLIKKKDSWPYTKKANSVTGSNGTNLPEDAITTITVNTEGFNDGDTVYYSIATVSGPTLTGADFDSGSLTGSFIVNSSGVGSFNVEPIGDGIAENNTCKIEIRRDSASGLIIGESATLTMTDAAVPLSIIRTYTTGSAASWMNFRTKYATSTGFDSSGMWITGNASTTGNSYPIVTNEGFTDTNLELSYAVVKNDGCSDHGICIFRSGTSPTWNWGTNTSRIAFQWNCGNPNWYPASGGSASLSGASTNQTYYVFITMDLLTGAITTVIRTGSFTGTVVSNYSSTLTGATLSSLSGWVNGSSTWEIGFDADQDNSSVRSYFRDITIEVIP